MLLDKNQIDKVFEEAKDQAEAFIGLYGLVYPDFKKIESIEGHPRVSRELNDYIFQKFIKFDQEKHPDVMAGGLWMNRGFGMDEDLIEFEVRPAPAKYKMEA